MWAVPHSVTHQKAFTQSCSSLITNRGQLTDLPGFGMIRREGNTHGAQRSDIESASCPPAYQLGNSGNWLQSLNSGSSYGCTEEKGDSWLLKAWWRNIISRKPFEHHEDGKVTADLWPLNPLSGSSFYVCPSPAGPLCSSRGHGLHPSSPGGHLCTPPVLQVAVRVPAIPAPLPAGGQPRHRRLRML